ncbi:MAG: hypothetical protein WA952_04545 [Lewinella sp.]
MKSPGTYIHTYISVWWVPLLVYAGALVIFALGRVVRRDWVIDVSLTLFLLNLLGMIAVYIFHLSKGRWHFSLAKFCSTVVLFFVIAFVMTFDPPDYYGANKHIPSDVPFAEPIDRPPSERDFIDYDLVLGSYLQPGIYTYFSDFQPEEPGSLYIKAFEITSSDRLSAERIKLRSRIDVDTKARQVWQGEFTIYGGSWGDKYGSRIELWFEPRSGKGSFKFTDRNYIVEGWMR